MTVNVDSLILIDTLIPVFTKYLSYLDKNTSLIIKLGFVKVNHFLIIRMLYAI